MSEEDLKKDEELEEQEEDEGKTIRVTMTLTLSSELDQSGLQDYLFDSIILGPGNEILSVDEFEVEEVK